MISNLKNAMKRWNKISGVLEEFRKFKSLIESENQIEQRGKDGDIAMVNNNIQRLELRTMFTVAVNVENDNAYCRFRLFTTVTNRVRYGKKRP